MPSLPCNLVFRVQISLIEGGDSRECAVWRKRPYGERALGLRDEVVVRACGEERASQRARGFAGVVVGASRVVIARGPHGDRSGWALRAGITPARGVLRCVGALWKASCRSLPWSKPSYGTCEAQRITTLSACVLSLLSLSTCVSPPVRSSNQVAIISVIICCLGRCIACPRHAMASILQPSNACALARSVGVGTQK